MFQNKRRVFPFLFDNKYFFLFLIKKKLNEHVHLIHLNAILIQLSVGKNLH